MKQSVPGTENPKYTALNIWTSLSSFGTRVPSPLSLSFGKPKEELRFASGTRINLVPGKPPKRLFNHSHTSSRHPF